MTAPYMPLYIADYHADTTHLTRSEHGAYLLLLMAMWRGGGKLPTDDTKLARLAKCTAEEWADMRGVILDFFKRRGGTITHKRLSAEYAKYQNTIRGKSSGGKASAAKKMSENKPNAVKILETEPQQNSTNQNQNQNQKEEGGGGSASTTVTLADLGWPESRSEWVDQLLAQTGCADPNDTWPLMTTGIVVGWHMTDRFEWQDVITGIKSVVARRSADPPRSWKYFSPAIARAKADRTTPTPEAQLHERRNRNQPEQSAGRSTAYIIEAVSDDQQRRDAEFDRASSF